MTEQPKVRRVSTFWQLPADEAHQLVEQAKTRVRHERVKARQAAEERPPQVVPVAAATPRLPMPVMTYRESLEVGGRIADALGERAGEVRLKVRKIVRYFGTARCEAWREEAQAIFDGEGMLTQDGTRKRTLGGVWFYLVRSSPDRPRVRLCFPRPAQQKQADNLSKESVNDTPSAAH